MILRFCGWHYCELCILLATHVFDWFLVEHDTSFLFISFRLRAETTSFLLLYCIFKLYLYYALIGLFSPALSNCALLVHSQFLLRSNCMGRTNELLDWEYCGTYERYSTFHRSDG